MRKIINKNEEGITLIALVITIIVLIILAGVAISMLSGENGILNHAAKAKTQYEVAGLKEEVEIILLEKEMDENVDIDRGMEHYLSKIQGAKVEKGAEDTWFVTRGTSTVTVYDDGEIVGEKIELWDGESSEAPELDKEFNWYIYNAEQLKFFADYVNSKNETTGEYVLTNEQKDLIEEKGYKESDLTIGEDTIVYLMANIDLGAREENGNWSTENNEKIKWTPIGQTRNKKFTGTFEGNNHYVRGVYVLINENFGGLFGNSDTIRNLSIKNSYIKSTEIVTGGIVGALREGELTNCHNINTQVIGELYSVGGVVGQSQGMVKDCSNTGSVSGFYVAENIASMVGGIVGLSISNVENCKNSGTITGEGNGIGGIVGASDGFSIINSINNGTIIGKKERIGGIAGSVQSEGSVSNSKNEGRIEGINQVGGIIGFINGNIEECYNKGEVTGRGECIGGICGIIGETVTTIQNTYNKGKIIGEGNTAKCIGGIVGAVSVNATTVNINNNYNVGQIEIKGTGVTSVGGAIGYIKTTDTLKAVKNYFKAGVVTQVGSYTSGTSKTEAEMKADTFVDTMNEGLAENAWEKANGRNNGYPVLIGME